MKKRNKALLAGIVIAGAAAVPTVALAGGDVDMPITGADLDQATAVALAFTGNGRVTGTEVGDEESYYEVEVTLSDGTQVDIQLDEQFNVVGSKADGKGENQSGGD